MVKNLSERISARIHSQKSTGIVRNRSEFLAIQSDIKKAIADGWPIKVIWETLQEEGKISFGYHTFISYINRFVRTTNETPNSKSPSIQKAKVKKLVPPKDTQPKFVPNGIPSFNYNPQQMDDKDLF